MSSPAWFFAILSLREAVGLLQTQENQLKSNFVKTGLCSEFGTRRELGFTFAGQRQEKQLYSPQENVGFFVLPVSQILRCKKN